jgi:hypothetical protein
MVADQPVENVVLKLDETGTYPVSAGIRNALPLKYKHKVRNYQALNTFRGTLVDSILQPNVRLGNGLDLSTILGILSLEMKQRGTLGDVKEKRRGDDKPAHMAPAKNPEKTRDPSSRKRPSAPWLISSSPVQNEDLKRQEADVAGREQDLVHLQQQFNAQIATKATRRFPHGYKGPRPVSKASQSGFRRKAAEPAAKERELEQREELLRWKRKTWWLEQKLARVTGDFIKTEDTQPTRDKYDGSQAPDQPRAFPMNQGSVPAPFHESAGDMLSPGTFDLDNAAPPQDLANLRLRLEPPSRRTLRPKRISRSR